MCDQSLETNGDGMESIWQPKECTWNGRPFKVFAEPVCFRAYGLNRVSIEAYHPDLYDSRNPEDWRDLPLDEICHLHILKLQGLEKTLEIHILMDEARVCIPDDIVMVDTDNGYHRGGSIEVKGRRYKINGCRVSSTEPEDQRRFQAEQGIIVEESGSSVDEAINGAERLPDILARLPVAMVKRDWLEIELPDGSRLDLEGRKKRKGVALKAIWDYCKENSTNEFEWGEIRDTKNHEGEKLPESRRLIYDVFRDQKEEIKKLVRVFDRPTEEKYTLRCRFNE